MKKNDYLSIEIRFQTDLLNLAAPLAGKGIVVAFSGGPDSTALLHLLAGLKNKYEFKLFAAHLNHGLRGEEAERDLLASRKEAERLNIEFYCEMVDCRAKAQKEGLSLEEACREARYDFLENVRIKTDSHYIAAGHNADDNAEAFLLNLLRGAGPQGLSGIPPQRGTIIRPILNFHRHEIINYLNARNLTWVEDSTNEDVNFLRNRVRRELLPQLERDFNLSIQQALIRTAGLIREEEFVWDRLIDDVKTDVNWNFDRGTVCMDLAPLRGVERALARRLIRAAVHQTRGTTRSLTLEHVDSIIEIVQCGQGGLDLPAGTRAWAESGLLYIGQSPPEARVEYEYEIPTPGAVVIKELGIRLITELVSPMDIDVRTLEKNKAAVDKDLISFPLKVRNLRRGDRFQPLGMEGTKKLSDFYIDAKISSRKRYRIPLVTDSEGIIWVGGLRLSERVKVGASAKNILLLILEPAGCVDL